MTRCANRLVERGRFESPIRIRLDRFFISGVAESAESIAMVRAVLAEGIETREQLETLCREGCDEAQGFLLGRPEPVRGGGP
jgi:EAL domain-containing protein (putative c-di-GMP-specific phosphodiesterase class I)